MSSPMTPEHALVISSQLLAQGQLAPAVEILDELIATRDVVAGALYTRGLVHHEQGRTEEAKRDLSAATKVSDRFFYMVRNQGLGHYLDDVSGTVIRTAEDPQYDPTPNRFPVRRWPDAMVIRDMEQLRGVVLEEMLPAPRPEERFLHPGDKAITFGSCFAVNVGRALKAKGIDVLNYLIPEDVNSTFANYHLFRWVFEGNVDKFTNYFHSLYGEEHRHALRAGLGEARLVVCTVGVAPCLFNEDTGAFAFTTPRRDKAGFDFDPGDYRLRTTTVTENVDNMQYIFDRVQEAAPDARIVLSVSPVPLSGTHEFAHIVQADCISKSTMRLVAHELTRDGTVLYWPSFEIVRWLAGHADFRTFGADDPPHARHVNMEVVDMIMELFLERYLVSTSAIAAAE